MPTLPWQARSTKTSPGETTAMLTYLPLKHWWDTPRFFVYIIKIYLQLRRTSGLIGFSMRARPLSKRYWTLSLWDNDEAIGRYIHTPPHAKIMRTMHGKMGSTAFVSWKVDSARRALEWEAALKRKTRSY